MKINKLVSGLIAVVAGIVSSQVSAIQPAPLYVVADDYINQHLVTEHEEALLRFKEKVDEYSYKQSWRFYQFDDGRHVAFNMQQTQDYHGQSDKDWAAVADKFDAEFLASNSAVYRETISKQHFYQMSYNEALSFEPQKRSETPLSHMVYVELQIHRNAKIRDSLTAWIEEQKQSKDKLYFSTYSKHFGSNTPTLYMIFHASSFIDFYKKLEKKGVFDPVQLLPEAVKAGIAEYHISLAKYVPEISY